MLKRRGYVRQDEETQRYGLTLKMLDLSFRFLGRSELRLHAYPVLREYVLGSGLRAFIAVPAADEVTYVWATGADDVAMRTVYGKAMPAHCSLYFSPTQATRRLGCLRLDRRATSPTAPPCCGASGRRRWTARRRRWGARARRWWTTRAAKWRGSAFSVTRRTRPRW